MCAASVKHRHAPRPLWPPPSELLQCRPSRGTPHTFAEPSTDTVRHFHFPIDEIAHALVLLGRGTSYYLTAYEARERSGRRPSSDTYLPAFWLERFAPAILQELLPQPEQLGIVLIDQAPFHVAAVDGRGYPIPGGRLRFTGASDSRGRE